MLIGVAALVVLAPLLAWVGHGFGRKVKGGLVAASMLLGLGEAIDPPSKHAVESTERKKGSPDNGEPPLKS